MTSTVSGAERTGRAPTPLPTRRARIFARLWRLLPVVAFCFFVVVQPGLPRGDAAGVYVTAASLVERGSFAIDGYVAAIAPSAPTADAPPAAYPQIAYAAGHYYHAVPPGRALLAVRPTRWATFSRRCSARRLLRIAYCSSPRYSARWWSAVAVAPSRERPRRFSPGVGSWRWRWSFWSCPGSAA